MESDEGKIIDNEEVKLPVADEPSVKGMHHQSSSSSLSSSYCEDESITTNTFEDAADGDNIEAIVIDNLLQTDHQNKTAKTEIDSPSAVEQSNTAADSLTEDIDIDELVVTNTSSSDAAATATAAKNINSISTEMCYSEDTSHHTELMPSSATNIQSDPFDKETLNTDDIPTDINEETELLAKPEATVAVRFDKEKYDEEIMRHVPIALKDRDINEEAELTAQTSSIVAVRFDKEKYDEEIMRHVPIPLPPSPTKKKEYDFSDGAFESKGALPDPRPSLPQLGDIPKLFHETHADEPRPSLPQLGDLNTLYHDDDQLEGQIAGDDIIKVDSISKAHAAPDSVDAIAMVHAAPDSGTQELGALPDPRPSLPQLGDIPKLFHETHADEPRPSLPQLGDLNTLYHDDDQLEGQIAGDDIIKVDSITVAHAAPDSVDAIATGDVIQVDSVTAVHAAPDSGAKELGALPDPRPSLPQLGDIPKLFHETHADEPRPSLPQLGDLDSLYPDTSEDNTVITTIEEKESETDGIKDDEIAIAFKESGSDKSRLSIASTGDASVERQFQESEAALPRASLPTVDDIPTLFTGSEIDKTTAAAAHNTVKEEPELSNRISLSADNLSSHLQDTVTIPTPIATKEINSSSSSSSSDDEKDSNDLVAGPADADSDKDTGGTVLTETPVTPPQSPTPLPAITEEKDGIKLERKQSSSSASSGWSFSETDSAPPPVPHRTRVPNQTEADILDDEVDGEHVDIKTIEKIFNDEKNQTVQTTEPETGVNENNNLDVDNTEASAAAAAGAAAAVGGERELNGTNREEQPFAPPVTPATGTHETSPTTDNLNKVLDDLDKLLESPIKEKTDDESLTSVSSKESSSSSSSDEEQQQQHENKEKTKVDPLIITIDGRDAKLDIEPTTTDNNTADENKNTEPDEPTTGEHKINNEPSSEPTSEKHEKRKHSTSSDSDEEEPKHKKLEPVDAIEPSSESSHHIPLYRISKPPTKADIIDQNKDSPTRPPIDLYPELATEDTTNPDEVLKENVAPVASAAEPLDEDKPIDLDTTGPDLSPDPTDKTPLAPVSKSNTLNSTGAQSSEPDAASDIETEPETAPLNPTPIKEKPKKKKKSGLSGLLSCCPCKSKKSNKAKNRSS